MALTLPATDLPIPADAENKLYYDDLKKIFSIIKTKENIHLGSIGTSKSININGKINIKAPENISVTGGVNIKDPHTIEVTGDCHSGFRKCLECKKMFPTTDIYQNTYCGGCALDFAIYWKNIRYLYRFNNVGERLGIGSPHPNAQLLGIPQNQIATRLNETYGNSWTPEHNKIISEAHTSGHPTQSTHTKQIINFTPYFDNVIVNGQYPCTINNYYAIPLDSTKKKVVQSGGSRNKKSDNNNNKLKNKKSGNIHTKKRTAETKYNRTKRRGINLLN